MNEAGRHPLPGADLFAPWSMGPLRLSNRLALAPMTVAYANPDGSVTRAEVEHYARRARGGVGLVITEHFTISESGRQLPRQTMVSDRRFASGLGRLADEVHAAGAAIVAQIGHAGRYAGPWDRYDEQRRTAPSAVPFRLVGDRVVTPQEITMAEIRRAVDDFGRAAELLMAAGFDGVQVHGSQGFLPSQFLSPRINRREDDYGGSFTGRIRFLCEAVAAVRSRVPADRVVGVQLLADEMADGGWTFEEAVRLAKTLEAAGVDFLLPSVTTFETVGAVTARGEAPRWARQAETTATIQSSVSIPVWGNGGISEPAHALGLVRDGTVAGVALARPLLADPDWAVKAAGGDPGAIVTCRCQPPTCLRTQLTGSICGSWPPADREAGYSGYSMTARHGVGAA